MPPSWDVDQAPYDRSCVPVPVVPYTTSATDKAAHDDHHRAAGERARPPLRQRPVDERRAAKQREQDGRRSDADEHQPRERNVRRHADGPACAARPSGAARWPRHDRHRGKEPAFALIPRGRFARDHRKRMFGRMRDEARRPELPQGAGLRIEAGEPDPAVSHEPFDVRVALHDAPDAIRSAFHDDRQSRGLVDLDHLPRKAGAQIALRAIHHAEQRGDVVRQFGAAAIPGRIDVAEVVLEADAGDDRHHRRHDAREDRAIVVARSDRTTPETRADRGTARVSASAGR